MKIATLGDSLIRDMSAYLKADNFAIGSSWIDYVIQTIEPIDLYSYNIIYLMVGINDLVYLKLDIDVVIEKYNRLLDVIRAKTKAEINIHSLLPTDNIELNNKIKAINNKLKDINNVKYIDIWSIFINEKTEKIINSKTRDGIHLTQLAYKEWADYLINTKRG